MTLLRKHPAHVGQPPTTKTKNYLSQNFNRAVVETPLLGRIALWGL